MHWAAAYSGPLLASSWLTARPFLQRVRARPAARYVHPKALAYVAEYDANLDMKLEIARDTAPNYLRWIADLIRPYLGHEVLEVGAGIGSITELYADGRAVVASDISDDCVQALRARFAKRQNITVVQKDLRAFGEDGRTFDSVVMINVLEHIEDDSGVLAELSRLLSPGGNVVIYVPALNGLYGRWDSKVGHYRRYSKWRLREVAHQAGLEVAELRYVNALAIPAWLAFSRTDVDRTQSASLSVWDRTGVPLSRALERRFRVPVGLNLLAVLKPLSCLDVARASSPRSLVRNPAHGRGI
jgi:SAM-dependent methyltransferase